MAGLTTKLTELFKETGRKHHQAFQDTDGADPDWAIWYADYLIDRLPHLLEASLTRSDLIDLLVRLSKEHARKAPGTPWPRYYATFFVEHDI